MRRADRLLLAAGRLLLAALALPAAARADNVECLAFAELEPARAFVGQPVLWRLEILRQPDVIDVDWLEGPVFPDFRAEWLPGDRTAEPRVHAGRDWLASRERRVLFPARPGRFLLPDATLACAREGGARAEARARGVGIEVIPLPEFGRPDDFGGVVGAVAVATHLSPEAVALGETAWLSVHVRGSGNLFNLRPPLDADALAGVDVFPEPPQLARDVGRTLGLRVAFRYALVPRAGGVVEIPEVRIPWFDPSRGRYEVARAAARRLTVGPAAAPGRTARPGAPRGALRAPAPALLAAAAALAALLALGVLLARARRRWARGAALRKRVRAGLEAARAAHARGDVGAALAAWDAALRRALAARLPGAEALAAAELDARAGDDPALAAAAALAGALERARFAGAAPPAQRDVERVLGELCSAP